MAKKILIAEDEPAFSLLLKTRLASLGHEIITAADGLEALTKILKEKPDLVILDVMMPKMSGYQLVQQLATVPDLAKKTAIIVMSANHQMKDFFNSWDTAAFLPKPFDTEELMFRVTQALQDATLRTDPKSLHSENLKNRAPGDQNKKRVLVIGQNDFIASKVKEFMESLGLAVSVELDDKMGIETATNSKFDFILCQFWEDPTVLNAAEVYAKTRGVPHLESVPFALFCLSALAIDARQAIEKIPVIPFTDSTDLKLGLHNVLKRKALVSG